MSRQSAADGLVRLLGPVVARAGLDLEEIVVVPAGRRRLLRVVVDKDKGVSLDDVAAVSRAVSEALDTADVLGGAAYVLEVSSPGVDRPLREPRHWRRARGRLVVATLVDDGEVKGRVIDVRDGGVLLDVAGKERSYGWSELASARVEVEFGPVRVPGFEDSDSDDDSDDTDDTDEPDEEE